MRDSWLWYISVLYPGSGRIVDCKQSLFYIQDEAGGEQTERARPAWSSRTSTSHTCSVLPSQPVQLSRSIPITLSPISLHTAPDQIVKLQEGNEKEDDAAKAAGETFFNPKIRKIPIEILDSDNTQEKVEAMSSVRTIPIQRMSQISPPQLSRTPSGESESFPSQKIKMGTSAIKIPIQVSWKEFCTVDSRLVFRFKDHRRSLRRERLSHLKESELFPYWDKVYQIPVLSEIRRTDKKDPGTLPIIVLKRKKAKMNSKSRDCKKFMSNLKYKIFNFWQILLFRSVKEARRKVAAQADVLSAGYEHLVRPPGPPGVSGRTADSRSRSVETTPCHRHSQNTARSGNLWLKSVRIIFIQYV